MDRLTSGRGPDNGAISMSPRRMLVPLALAQFICSFAGSNMNVMLTDISTDLDTTVEGVQTVITVFLVVMAIFMIPGSKLSDRWGRKRCFTLGLSLYGVGALLSAISPSLGVLLLGNSIFEGLGTALLIPPVYILTTIVFEDITSRAWAFGVISALGGIGAAAGPLIGGVITTAVDWRAAFIFQAAVVGMIILLSRGIRDPLPADPDRPFDVVGTILSAVGMCFLVIGILQADTDLLLMVVLMVVGIALLAAFACGFATASGSARSRCCRPGCSVTGCRTWDGHPEHAVAGAVGDFVHRVGLPAGGAWLQRDRDWGDLHRRHARHPGLLAGRAPPCQAVRAAHPHLRRIPGDHRRHCPADRPGQVLRQHVGVPPGLLLIGLGLGGMLTPSVNIVQSSFPETLQGEISGLSRSVSNLGSSFGTAIAGTILVSDIAAGSRSYSLAMSALAVFAVIGLVTALLLPAGGTDRPKA